MERTSLEDNLFEALSEVPVIDMHTHLVGGRLGARGLHDILLYHMAVSDLYAAGCPSGHRLTEYPGWPDDAEAHPRIEEVLPHLPKAANTSTSWMIRILLADLYDWREPIDAGNWRRLNDLIRERRDDRLWHREVLRRMNVKRVGTEWSRREDGQDDDILQYSLEWAFFARCQRGEFDTALHELERCWGKPPGIALAIGEGKRTAEERRIESLDDVHEALQWYVDALASCPVLSTATHLSTDLDLRCFTEDEMIAALGRRDAAGPKERSVYAAYVHERFLESMARQCPEVVFQFSFAAEPLPFETGSRLSQETIRQLGEMIERHPGVRFQSFLASRHANQALCTLCRELPNFSLAGYWWHNFYPPVIRQIMEERLDMLPVNKQVGFFSDAYCVEWAYAKLLLVRRCLAQVLAAKVRTGQYDRGQALSVAREILFESPQSLLGFEPSTSS